MPSASRSQQRLFGMVHACQKHGKCSNEKVAKIAKNISFKAAEDFARTKHANLPEKKIESNINSFEEFIERKEIEMLSWERFIVSEATIDTATRQLAGMTASQDVENPNVRQLIPAVRMVFNRALKLTGNRNEAYALIEQCLKLAFSNKSGGNVSNRRVVQGMNRNQQQLPHEPPVDSNATA